MTSRKLPLGHVKVIEMEGIGPSSMVGMLLADHGAQVTLVSSVRRGLELVRATETDQMHRGKKSIVLDLKHDGHKVVFEKLVKTADVFFDSFRPQTMSRLGFPVERLADLNPRIIVAKMTSYGSHAKLANRVGHDLNFAALSGTLSTLRAPDSTRPPMPSVFIGDVSGVALCFSSILLALLNKARGYESHQVIDLSYAEACLYLSVLPMTLHQAGFLGSREKPGALNGALCSYEYYQSREGSWFALGALEYKFFLSLLSAFKVDLERFEALSDAQKKALLQAEFARRSDRELEQIMQEHPDTCLTPVLGFENNGFLHEQNRPIMLDTAAGKHVLPATRLLGHKKDTYMSIMSEQKMPVRGQHNAEILKSLNLSHQELEEFYSAFTAQKL